MQAGGLTLEAAASRVEISRIIDYDISTNKAIPKRTVVKTIDIGKDLMLGLEAQEFILHPMDEVFIKLDELTNSSILFDLLL